MSHLDPARRATASELRSFGLLVGGAFVAVAALVFWRSSSVSASVVIVLASLGGALIGAGVAMPRILGSVYAGWMRFAVLLSRITTPLLMGVIYFLVLTPIALLMRMAGRNPLGARSGPSLWITRPPAGRASSLERQF